MIIGIYTNPNRDIRLKYTGELISLCKKYSLDYLVDDKIDIDIDAPRGDVSVKADIVFTLGGDGTVLHYVRQIKDFSNPILGVNIGNLGFLTDGDASDLELFVSSVKEGKYKVGQRTMFDVKFKEKSYTVLNEVALRSTSPFKLADIKLTVDELSMEGYRADGMIISTPTGSTAYALSAGGPILTPDARGIIIAPLCPFGLNNRSLVVSDEHVVTIEPNENDLIVALDGLETGILSAGERLSVCKSKKTLKIVTVKDKNFYKLVKEKLDV